MRTRGPSGTQPDDSPVPKLAEPRFYVDADILGLAHALCIVRNDVTYPGFQGGDKKNGRLRLPCPITLTDTDDEVWIHETAKHGWLIITRDTKIQERTAEINAVRESGARMVALVGRDAKTAWDQLEICIRKWARFETLLKQPGPFIYAVGATSFRNVSLTPKAQRAPRKKP